MPSQRCVMQDCNNCSDKEKGPSIYNFFWTSFVTVHRPHLFSCSVCFWSLIANRAVFLYLDHFQDNSFKSIFQEHGDWNYTGKTGNKASERVTSSPSRTQTDFNLFALDLNNGKNRTFSFSDNQEHLSNFINNSLTCVSSMFNTKQSFHNGDWKQ